MTGEKLAHLDEPSEAMPDGWHLASIGDLLSLTSGKYIKRDEYSPIPDQPFPVAGAGGPIGWTNRSNFCAPVVTLGRVGAAGALSVYETEAWVTDNALVIQPFLTELLPLLKLFFSTVNWADLHTGSSQPLITQTIVKSLLVRLPPLAEQKRIVAKVEELLARVNAARARLAKVPQILRRFRQSVLAAACSGRLTEDWRSANVFDAVDSGSLVERLVKLHAANGHGGKAAEPTYEVHDLAEATLPQSWTISELKVLCKPGRPITYGILKPGPDQSDGVPYIRVADFPGDLLRVDGIKKTTRQIAQDYRRSALESGDILLSIRGTVGRVCRVPSQLAGSNITQDTARISVHREISADYVEMYLRSPDAQRRLEAAMKGVAVRGVNIGDVRALQIAIPPLEEQHEIVRRVDGLLQLADKIGARVAAASRRTEKLIQAILSKAIRGELVPTEAELARQEGRSYESASVLLERIRAQRAAATNGMPSRNGSARPKSATTRSSRNGHAKSKKSSK